MKFKILIMNIVVVSSIQSMEPNNALLPKQELPELQKLETNWTAQLFRAAQTDDIELAKIALKNGAKINAIDNREFNPLSLAIMYGKGNIAAFFVDQPDIDTTTWKHPVTGWSMVELATQRSLFSIKNLIMIKESSNSKHAHLMSKVQYEIYEDKKNNPIFRSKVKEGEFTSVKASRLKHDLSVQGGSKVTSSYVSPTEENIIQCMLATQANNVEMFQYFLNQGVEINSQNHEGLTLLDVAQKNNSKDIIAILETLGAENGNDVIKNSTSALARFSISDTHENSIAQAIAKRNVDELEKLLEGVDINEIDKRAKVPLLFQSVKESSYGVISLLLNTKLDINKPDKNSGWTPLMQAAVDNREDVVTLLLEKGADVNLKTPLGLTAHDLAKQNKREDITHLIQGFVASKKN